MYIQNKSPIQTEYIKQKRRSIFYDLMRNGSREKEPFKIKGNGEQNKECGQRSENDNGKGAEA